MWAMPTEKRQPRVIKASVVAGRADMSRPEVVYGAEAWAVLTSILPPLFALAGEEAVVDRTLSRVVRVTQKPR